MNGNGEVEWAQQISGTNMNIRSCMAGDQEGNFYLAGNFNEQVFFEDTVFDAGSFNMDVYITKMSPSGKLLWARHGRSIADNDVIGLTVDYAGNVYLAGHFLYDAYFDEVDLIYTLCCGSREIYIVNYSYLGDALWGKQISGARANTQSISMSEGNEIYVSGFFRDTVNFDDMQLSSTETYKNFMTSVESDIYVGIPRDKEPEKLYVYPNPAGEWLILKDFPSGGNYRLTSSDGRFIREAAIISDRISLSGLARGSYVLEVFGSDTIKRTIFLIR
jgi:hypothetical protein